MSYIIRRKSCAATSPMFWSAVSRSWVDHPDKATAYNSMPPLGSIMLDSDAAADAEWIEFNGPEQPVIVGLFEPHVDPDVDVMRVALAYGRLTSATAVMMAYHINGAPTKEDYENAKHALVDAWGGFVREFGIGTKVQ